jgi:hypothetical protein
MPHNSPLFSQAFVEIIKNRLTEEVVCATTEFRLHDSEGICSDIRKFAGCSFRPGYRPVFEQINIKVQQIFK